MGPMQGPGFTGVEFFLRICFGPEVEIPDLRPLMTINPEEVSMKLPDIAASYQECIIDTLLDKVKTVYEKYNVKDILVVGGVSCNQRFRDKSYTLSQELNSNIIFPDIEYCTDNAAMIAITGWKKFLNNDISSLDILPYSSYEYQ